MERKIETFEYGIMSSRFSLNAENKFTAYCAMVAHLNGNSHLIALYEPKKIVEHDSWLNPFGKISKRLDEIYGGEGAFDDYFYRHIEEVRQAYKTIKQII